MDITLNKLMAAADNHGVDSGEPDQAIGDLRDMLTAAWTLMTPEQRKQLLSSEVIDNVVQLGSRDEFTVADLVTEVEAADPAKGQVFEGFRHSELASVVRAFDGMDRTVLVDGERKESSAAMAARFIRSVIDAQLQHTPVFWYSEQHGELKVRQAHEVIAYDGYTWQPAFTGVNALIQTIGIPVEWPTCAMEDAFAATLPTYTRDEVDHPNDTGRIKVSALFEGDNFRNAMLAAFRAAPVLSAAEESIKYTAVRDAIQAALPEGYPAQASELDDAAQAAIAALRTQ